MSVVSVNTQQFWWEIISLFSSSSEFKSRKETGSNFWHILLDCSKHWQKYETIFEQQSQFNCIYKWHPYPWCTTGRIVKSGCAIVITQKLIYQVAAWLAVWGTATHGTHPGHAGCSGPIGFRLLLIFFLHNSTKICKYTKKQLIATSLLLVIISSDGFWWMFTEVSRRIQTVSWVAKNKSAPQQAKTCWPIRLRCCHHYLELVKIKTEEQENSWRYIAGGSTAERHPCQRPSSSYSCFMQTRQRLIRLPGNSWVSVRGLGLLWEKDSHESGVRGGHRREV